ncbi:hypothetical protein Q8F55_003966 [Vanrija albida]|uniref:Uncharacterized protein n=1 Tax=Vanrija albida TaxID=181172 RepID=A0ABR3Q604_9TREE
MATTDPPPLNLAGVTHVDDSLIDPSLAHAADFFTAAAEAHDQKFDDELARAAVAAAHHHQQQLDGGLAQHLVAGLVDSVGDAGVGVGVGVGVSTEAALAHLQPQLDTQQLPLITPPAHIAPFSRPQRDDNTPHPEILAFANRAEFEVWFEGESSWCHFVQRRTTTPEKRAEERLRARIKAHERMLANMTPDEVASAPPLKRRRRNRTSTIKEKVTFTCHHAGRYEAKHSTTLPREKLRLNTKKSVKCDCPARIVLTEMEEGGCKASYFWQHEGHDAYADDELESGRLPKVIDEWLVAQIQAGKDTDEIRRSLTMTDEEKSAYLQAIAEDPSRIDPDKPPALALTLRIKYPDIYNRYRKLKGPIKDFKPPKNPRAARAKREDPKLEDVSEQVANEVNAQVNAQAAAAIATAAGVPHTLDYSHDVVEGFNMDAIDGAELPADLSFGHEGLARALLALPRSTTHGDVDGDAELSEAVLRMANEANAQAEQEAKEREAWGSIGL